jgi:hypothetical protein
MRQILMGLRQAVLAAANALTVRAIRIGIPQPPYMRRNGIPRLR